ncbi:MAG: 2-amino-4-hydroxy-6-hydroxymethyldihydropteridine diphosphokinase [Gemmatimonadota bacterium]
MGESGGPSRPAAGAETPAVTSVILALGSNLGDRRAHLRRGLRGLEPQVLLEATSRLVESAPWGPVADQPDFLNLVVRARTRLNPGQLLELIRQVEAAEGRTRATPQGPRTLDIDIVFFGDSRVHSPTLRIPHPRWRDRSFVARLVPDVAGVMIDPESGRPLADLATAAPLPSDLTEVVPLRLESGARGLP